MAIDTIATSRIIKSIRWFPLQSCIPLEMEHRVWPSRPPQSDASRQADTSQQSLSVRLFSLRHPAWLNPHKKVLAGHLPALLKVYPRPARCQLIILDSLTRSPAHPPAGKLPYAIRPHNRHKSDSRKKVRQPTNNRNHCDTQYVRKIV